MRTPSLVLTLLATASLLGCPKKEDPTGDSKPTTSASASTPAASGSSASAHADAAASAKPTSPPPCTVAPPVVVDTGVRLETGITKRKITAEQLAIGYAVADGVPKVVVVDNAGAVTKTEVEWGHVKDQEKKKLPDMTRRVERVTPIGPVSPKGGGKYRVAMDFVDTSKEKNAERYLRCGAADQEPIVHDPTNLNFFEPNEDDILKIAMFDEAKPDQNTYDTRDCRTFTDGESVWAVATVMRRAAKDTSEVLVEWIIDETPGKAKVKDHLLDKRILKADAKKKYPTMDHFLTPVSINAGTAGYVIVAREQGSLVFAHRTDKLEKVGNPVSHWLGAPVDMPGIAHEKERAFLVATEYKKTDLFAATWLGDKAPPKPVKVTLEDGNPPPDGSEREAPTVSPGPDGNVFVAFADGDKKSRRARLTVLGPDMKQLVKGVVDVTPEGVNVAETRVVALPGKKALVTYLEDTGKLSAALVTCQY